MKTATTLFSRQQGSTLIEILVSMFILALGLMALIAMQTRTSIGIKEAENQTIIAQATENLAENMITNPLLLKNNTNKKKLYEHYTGTFGCEGSMVVNAPASGAGDAGRTALANYHLASFRNTACQVVGVDGKVSATVGADTNGQVLHIKWTMGGSSEKDYTYDYPLDDNI